jgi:hypothetical protein
VPAQKKVFFPAWCEKFVRSLCPILFIIWL